MGRKAKPRITPPDIWAAAKGVVDFIDDFLILGISGSERREIVEAIALALLAERERGGN